MSVLDHGLCRAIVGLQGPKLLPDERRFLIKKMPLGVILFSRNIEDPDQLTVLTNSIRQAVGWNMPIFVDQEGGRVARMRGPHWMEFPPALDQMELVTPEKAARTMWLRGALIGAELAEMGVDVNCTPLADVLTDQTHPILANRLYGSNLEQVIVAARALDEGTRAAGVLSVLKHLPGYGRAPLDGHEKLSVIGDRLSILQETDFAAFAALHDFHMGMTAHVAYSSIDGQTPATFSLKIINMIRSEIGFSGLLMSDDISMGALQGDVAIRSHLCIAAGVDIVLHCNGDLNEMAAVVEVAGALQGSSAARAEIALSQRPSQPPKLDIGALKAEYASLVPNWPQ